MFKRPPVISPADASLAYPMLRSIEDMVQGALRADLPCLLVDDGSDAESAAVLNALEQAYAPQLRVHRLTVNQGKGAAVSAGLRIVQALGYTHAVQIDADGQHDTRDLAHFVGAVRAATAAMVCGKPVYDASVPKGRLYGRYLTHVWVWINTLSLDIQDSMCGYRVYPVASAVTVLDSATLGKRMDFDSEILVRMHWRGIRMLTLPTRVTYPSDGISHFKVWKDNVLISRMHARLFAGMLMRLPVLLGRKLISRRLQT